MSDLPGIDPGVGSRVLNVTGSQHCTFCCRGGFQTGWVFVGTSDAGTDQMAPCPHCELGYDVEFPAKNWVRFGKSWGKDGYWQGRDPEREGVVASCTCEVPGKMAGLPLSVRENRVRLWLLTRRNEQLAAGIKVDDERLARPDVGLELPAETERLAVMHREVARVEVLRGEAKPPSGDDKVQR